MINVAILRAEDALKGIEVGGDHQFVEERDLIFEGGVKGAGVNDRRLEG